MTDPKYLYPFVGLISLSGIISAITFNDPLLFQRMGNLIIGVGVWMSMRFTLREGINKHKDISNQSPTLSGNGPLRQLNATFLNNISYSIGDAKLQLHGFYIVLYGSIIGSWGDVLFKNVKLWLFG